MCTTSPPSVSARSWRHCSTSRPRPTSATAVRTRETSWGWSRSVIERPSEVGPSRPTTCRKAGLAKVIRPARSSWSTASRISLTISRNRRSRRVSSTARARARRTAWACRKTSMRTTAAHPAAATPSSPLRPLATAPTKQTATTPVTRASDRSRSRWRGTPAAPTSSRLPPTAKPPEESSQPTPMATWGAGRPSSPTSDSVAATCASTARRAGDRCPARTGPPEQRADQHDQDVQLHRQ